MCCKLVHAAWPLHDLFDRLIGVTFRQRERLCSHGHSLHALLERFGSFPFVFTKGKHVTVFSSMMHC